MTRKKTHLLLILSIILLWSCKEKSMEGMILLTLQQANEQDQSRIGLLDIEKPDRVVENLTPQFYSAGSPEISYDGKNILFSAKSRQEDPWQLYEMDLENHQTRRILNNQQNCMDPVYLPNGRLLFSMTGEKDSLHSAQGLYTCESNGNNLKRITFNPDSYASSTILKDGRILVIVKTASDLTRDSIQTTFMAMRPDGTKAELFYSNTGKNAPISKAYETATGRLLFIESGQGNSTGNITAIRYNRPLHSRENLSMGNEGDFRSVYPQENGKWLIVWRQSETENDALFEFNPENRKIGKVLYKGKDRIIQAIVIEKKERPKKLPSEVDTGVKTGLLLCQNIKVTELDPLGTNEPSFSSIEVMGIGKSLGVVPVEKDGSFYLKVKADTPIQIRALDDQGKILKSCKWIWLRPNERRGCVGCHESPEQVPENRVPLAVKHAPVTIPVHLTKLKEKAVALE